MRAVGERRNEQQIRKVRLGGRYLGHILAPADVGIESPFIRFVLEQREGSTVPAAMAHSAQRLQLQWLTVARKPSYPQTYPHTRHLRAAAWAAKMSATGSTR
jgi:hypothetical protein